MTLIFDKPTCYGKPVEHVFVVEEVDIYFGSKKRSRKE
jgi:hypothetical protein